MPSSPPGRARAAHVRRTRRVLRRLRAGVTEAPRVDAGGALDGLLDLIFPRRCVVAGPPEAGSASRAPATSTRSPTTAADAAARRRAPAPGRAPGRHWASARRAAASAPDAARLRLRLGGLLLRGPARALVTACKFRALRSLADDMARQSRRRPSRRRTPAVTAPVRPARPIVTSVPAHRDHRLERGFDLAEALARRLARDAGLPYAPLLRRVRHGARQSGLDRASRAANVHHAFALREGGIGGRY